jgi:hypothetical protein
VFDFIEKERYQNINQQRKMQRMKVSRKDVENVRKASMTELDDA